MRITAFKCLAFRWIQEQFSSESHLSVLKKKKTFYRKGLFLSFYSWEKLSVLRLASWSSQQKTFLLIITLYTNRPNLHIFSYTLVQQIREHKIIMCLTHKTVLPLFMFGTHIIVFSSWYYYSIQKKHIDIIIKKTVNSTELVSFSISSVLLSILVAL